MLNDHEEQPAPGQCPHPAHSAHVIASPCTLRQPASCARVQQLGWTSGSLCGLKATVEQSLLIVLNKRLPQAASSSSGAQLLRTHGQNKAVLGGPAISLAGNSASQNQLSRTAFCYVLQLPLQLAIAASHT